MSPPNQGYKYKASLTAAASDGAGALVASCGASRGGGIQLSGTWTGTVQFEQSLDNGLTWIAKTVYPAAGGTGVISATSNGQWKFACGGETQVRARCSAFTSGPIVVDATFTAGVDTKVAPSTIIDSAGQSINLADPTPKRLLDSGLIKTGAGTLTSMSVGAPGTTITVTVYDSTDGSGTVIFGPVTLAAGMEFNFGGGLTFTTGAYAGFSATTGTPNVTFGFL